MAVTILTRQYAYDIYRYGNRRFTARDGMQGIPESYHAPVKEYAATGISNGDYYPSAFKGFTLDQLNEALANGWINQQEYNETIAYLPQ